MRLIVCAALMTCFFHGVFAQEGNEVINIELSGVVRHFETNQKLADVTIDVKKDGSVANSMTTSSNGKYVSPLELGHVYTIIYSKPGFVSKRIQINTQNVPEDMLYKVNDIFVEMTLFETIEDLDFSLLDKPIGKSKYDPESKEITWDFNYTNSVQHKIAALLDAYERKKEEQSRKEAEYNDAMREGDNAMVSRNFENARKAYAKAQSAKPNDLAVKERLAALDKAVQKQKEQEAEAAAREKADAEAAAKQKAYEDAIAKGDKLYAGKEYQQAIAAYEKALEIKSDEGYPKDQIAVATQKIKDMAAEEAKRATYNKVIKEADDLLASKDLEGALAKYQEASGMMPNETYPKDKIAEIKDKQKALADAEAAKKEEEERKAKLEADYKAQITKADEAFKVKSWSEAKQAYEAALKLKPDESYPKEQIAKVEAQIDQLAKLDEDYNKAIQEGDRLFNTEMWDDAKAAYNKALQIKQDAYPKNQITAIDKKLDEIAKAEEEAKRKAEADAKAKEEAYASSIKKGDEMFAAKKWIEARGAYEEASKLKPEETYPKEQVKKIEGELAKMAEKDKKYAEAIKAADALYNKEQWQAAKAAYGQALRLKPEQYPKDQIAKIDQKVADIAAEEVAAKKKAEEEAAAREKAYSDAVKAGNAAYDAREWKKAREAYVEALGIKANEQHPKSRIEDIDKKLGDIAANEERYNEAVREADKLYESKQWEGAITGYRNALSFKSEQYPKNQITKIEGIMKEEKVQAEKQKMNDRYKSIITEADKLFTGNQLDAAAKKYNEALTVKSTEQYPKDKLAEIDRKKKQMANEAAAQKEKEARYNEIITKADAAFDEKKYEEAKGLYRESLNILGNKKHPEDRIKEIDIKLAELQKQQQEEERRKAAAAIQAQKEAEAKRKQELQQKQDKYNSLIAEADKAMREDKLEEAKGKYQKALDVIPNKSYPKQKILEIDNMIAQKEKEKQEEERKRQEALELKQQREEQGEKTGFKVKTTNTSEEQKDKKIQSKYSKKHNEKKTTKIKF